MMCLAFVNLIKPKAGAKNELLFNKPGSEASHDEMNWFTPI